MPPPQDGDGRDQGGAVDSEGAEVEAGGAGFEHPDEGGEEVEHRGPGLMEAGPAVRSYQLIELEGSPGAQIEEGLVAVEHQVGPGHHDPEGFDEGECGHRGDGQPADPWGSRGTRSARAGRPPGRRGRPWPRRTVGAVVGSTVAP